MNSEWNTERVVCFCVGCRGHYKWGRRTVRAHCQSRGLAVDSNEDGEIEDKRDAMSDAEHASEDPESLFGPEFEHSESEQYHADQLAMAK